MFSDYKNKKRDGLIIVDETKIEEARANPKAQLSIAVTSYNSRNGREHIMGHKFTLNDLKEQRDSLQEKLDGVKELIADIESYKKV